MCVDADEGRGAVELDVVLGERLRARPILARAAQHFHPRDAAEDGSECVARKGDGRRQIVADEVAEEAS